MEGHDQHTDAHTRARAHSKSKIIVAYFKSFLATDCVYIVDSFYDPGDDGPDSVHASADCMLQTIIWLADATLGPTPHILGRRQLESFRAGLAHQMWFHTLFRGHQRQGKYRGSCAGGEDDEETDDMSVVVESLDGVGRAPLRQRCTRQGLSRVVAHLTRWQMYDVVEKAVA